MAGAAAPLPSPRKKSRKAAARCVHGSLRTLRDDVDLVLILVAVVMERAGVVEPLRLLQDLGKDEGLEQIRAALK